MPNRVGKPPLGVSERRREKLLAVLRDHPDMLQKQMAAEIGVTPVALGSLLYRMEKQGLIRRVARWQVV